MVGSVTRRGPGPRGSVLALSASRWPRPRRGGRTRAAAGKLDFTRDVRPILADKCFACHGPDPAQRKGEAPARHRPTAPFGPAASGSPAVVAGKPDESELYQRIISDDPDEHMPPAKSGKTLTAAEVATLKAWIEQGAPVPRRTGRSSRRPGPTRPRSSDPAWCTNPVDRFVLARLEKEGLKPSPEADRVTLIRRLSLDLIGLPPTPAEVDAFLADTSADAYEKAGRPAARLAPLRRALGPALARRGALRRLRRLREGQARGRSGSTATGSSTPSTATCPTTTSSSSRSPATCCPARRRTRSSPPASCGTR